MSNKTICIDGWVCCRLGEGYQYESDIISPGNIRDFICDSCNTGLGRFKNGENYLLNAIQYLKERENDR